MDRRMNRMQDRARVPTEKCLAVSSDLDTFDIDTTLEVINAEDAIVAVAIRAALPQIAQLTRRAVTALEHGGRIVYFGAGTSGRLGVLDASECPPTFHSDPEEVIGLIAGGDHALRRSSEGAEDDPRGAEASFAALAIGSSDLVIGLAAGGTTPYVIGGIDLARARGATTALITCNADPNQDDPPPWPFDTAPPDIWVALAPGPEVVTGSTRMKAGTATKMVLNMVTTTVFVQRGKTWGNLMVDLRATNAKLRDRAVRILLATCPSLRGSREAAGRALDCAEGRVKRAIVMTRLDRDATEADALLRGHGGRLRAILGAPPCIPG